MSLPQIHVSCIGQCSISCTKPIVLKTRTYGRRRNLTLLFTKADLSELVAHDNNDAEFALLLARVVTVGHRVDMPAYFTDIQAETSGYVKEVEQDGVKFEKIAEFNSYTPIDNVDYLMSIAVYQGPEAEDADYVVVIENAPLSALKDKKIHRYAGKKVTIKY